VAPTWDIATPIFLVAGGMAAVVDHLNNSHFLVRPNVLFVKPTTCWFRFEQGSQTKSSPMNANLTSVPTTSYSQWYHDTGSNVHLTNELSNLIMHAEDYTGTNQIRVGNGQSLHISNSGRGLLPTPSRNFHLFSLSCCSQIQKNLISVN